MSFRVMVNASRCEGNGVCVGVVPGVFALLEEDLVTVLDHSPGDDLRGYVEQAAALCPRSAISIVAD